MKKLGTAPAAIINVETEAIIAIGCVISDIPLVHKLDKNPLKHIYDGDKIMVKADKGIIEIID
jgi:predicted aconitase with swiveling domain